MQLQIGRGSLSPQQVLGVNRSPFQVKENSFLPPALRHDPIEAEGYFTNYFSVGLDAQTVLWPRWPNSRTRDQTVQTVGGSWVHPAVVH